MTPTHTHAATRLVLFNRQLSSKQRSAVHSVRCLCQSLAWSTSAPVHKKNGKRMDRRGTQHNVLTTITTYLSGATMCKEYATLFFQNRTCHRLCLSFKLESTFHSKCSPVLNKPQFFDDLVDITFKILGRVRWNLTGTRPEMIDI